MGLRRGLGLIDALCFNHRPQLGVLDRRLLGLRRLWTLIQRQGRAGRRGEHAAEIGQPHRHIRHHKTQHPGQRLPARPISAHQGQGVQQVSAPQGGAEGGHGVVGLGSAPAWPVNGRAWVSVASPSAGLSAALLTKA